MSEKRPTRQRNNQRSEEAHDKNNEPPVKEKNSKKLLIILSSVFFVMLIGVGSFAFLIGKKSSHPTAATQAKKVEPEKKEIKIVYYTLTPGFAVEIKDAQKQSHFLQATICLTVSDESISDILKQYDPVIRNALLDTLGGSNYSELNTIDGKEKLRSAILNSIKNILADKKDVKKDDNNSVNSVLFVDYVME